MKSMIVILLLVAVATAACSPRYACERYGFHEGTPEMASCVQNEVLAMQYRAMKMAGKP